MPPIESLFFLVPAALCLALVYYSRKLWPDEDEGPSA